MKLYPLFPKYTEFYYHFLFYAKGGRKCGFLKSHSLLAMTAYHKLLISFLPVKFTVYLEGKGKTKGNDDYIRAKLFHDARNHLNIPG